MLVMVMMIKRRRWKQHDGRVGGVREEGGVAWEIEIFWRLCNNHESTRKTI